jgi:hypothetical protein
MKIAQIAPLWERVRPLTYSNSTQNSMVHTLHGIFTPDNEKMFAHGKAQPYLSISNPQSAYREYVAHRFGVEQMAAGYEAVYQQILADTFVGNGHFVRAG